MTTNQTIDGVPRKALADFIEYSVPGPYDQREKWEADKAELRALLDAPIPFPGYPPVPEDRKLPAAQPQGEPVAWQFYQDGKWWNGMDQNRHKENTIEAGYLVRDLYAEQPAPVAVLMPTQEDFERFIIRRDGSVNVSVLGKSRFYNDATIDREYFVWLTCLDEVTRLNPSL